MKLSKLFTVGLLGSSLLVGSFSFAAEGSEKSKKDTVEELAIKTQPRENRKWIKKQLKKNDSEAEKQLKAKNKKRKEEYNNKIAVYGERYELAVDIAKAAVKMMEEHRSPEAYVAGAGFLIQLSAHQEDISILRGLLAQCEQKQEELEKAHKEFGTAFDEEDVDKVKKEVRKLLNSKPLLFGLKETLLSALNEPTMDCTRDGGGFLYGAIFIGGASLHVVSCKSHYGRHVPYTFSTVKFGVGLAFAGHGKGTKVEKTEEGDVKVESYKIPYKLFSKNKLHFASAFTSALGLGVNKERENMKENFGSKNGVVGGFAIGLTGGLGYIKKWPEQTPDFKNLFQKIKLRF